MKVNFLGNCYVMWCLGKHPLPPFLQNVIYRWSLSENYTFCLSVPDQHPYNSMILLNDIVCQTSIVVTLAFYHSAIRKRQNSNIDLSTLSCISQYIFAFVFQSSSKIMKHSMIVCKAVDSSTIFVWKAFASKEASGKNHGKEEKSKEQQSWLISSICIRKRFKYKKIIKLGILSQKWMFFGAG